MSNPDFKVWQSRYVEGYCVVRQPAGVTKSFQLSSGVSRAIGWPMGLVCRMSDDFPKDIQLADSLFGAGLVVVSQRTRALLETANTPDLELLPVGIADHKGRVAADNYVIVNPLKVVDAIDVDASGVVWNLIQSDLIDSCQQLVIDAARVPSALLVFRLRHLEHEVIVRGELARQLEAVGLVGLALRDPAQFTGS
jgi:hypothetical protein